MIKDRVLDVKIFRYSFLNLYRTLLHRYLISVINQLPCGFYANPNDKIFARSTTAMKAGGIKDASRN